MDTGLDTRGFSGVLERPRIASDHVDPPASGSSAATHVGFIALETDRPCTQGRPALRIALTQARATRAADRPRSGMFL